MRSIGPGGAGYAEAVRAAREAAGKDPGELAAALDISYESYVDIEWFDPIAPRPLEAGATTVECHLFDDDALAEAARRRAHRASLDAVS